MAGGGPDQMQGQCTEKEGVNLGSGEEEQGVAVD